jgi:hypothetical protein
VVALPRVLCRQHTQAPTAIHVRHVESTPAVAKTRLKTTLPESAGKHFYERDETSSICARLQSSRRVYMIIEFFALL